MALSHKTSTEIKSINLKMLKNILSLYYINKNIQVFYQLNVPDNNNKKKKEILNGKSATKTKLLSKYNP